MFETVRNNKGISQAILAIIILPFAFFGMDAFFDGSSGGAEMAKVGDQVITTVDFDNAMRTRQDNIRRQAEGQFDPAIFASREFRRAVLESLINDRVLAQYVAENRLAVTAQQLQEVIGGQTVFQQDGQFSRERYEMVLQAQGMSPAMFENNLVHDIRTEQIVQAIGQSAFAGSAAVRQLVNIQLEERVFSMVTFEPQAFASDVTLDEGAAQAHYDSNRDRYVRPARLRAEYVVLDEPAVLARFDVDETRVREFYEANQAQYGQPEERRARHILVRVGASATETEVAAAREKAEALLEKVRSEPASFEDVAREESQDPGSARAGGDLGFFAPGAMVPAFDEAVFGREVDEIGDIVQTDFGFHIIQVTEIKPTTVRPFEEVRDTIAEDFRRQQASTEFPLLAEQFANTVFEQPDSLEPVAKALGLEVRTSDWISAEDGRLAEFDDPRLVDALFDPVTREAGENIEAIEVERGTLVSARVVEYEDTTQLPFEAVREDIEAQLRADEAAKLARERGEKVLAALNAGEEVAVEWGEALTEQRANPSLSPAATRSLFAASSDNLPAYVGVEMPGGSYSVLRLEDVSRPEIALDDPVVSGFAQQYDRLVAEQEFAAFVKALRERYGVAIRAAALEMPES